MSHAYTPGLKVSAAAEFTRDRMLPIPGEVLVKKGKQVEPDTVVAQALLPGNVLTANLSRQMGVPPADLSDLLLVQEGDEVTEGQAVATSKGIFGMFKQTVASPATGVFESFSTVSGQAIFREPPIPVDVKAYVGGKVSKLTEGLGVQVSAKGTMVQGIFGIGPETHGVVTIATDDPAQEMSVSDISPEHAGTILVGGSLTPLDVLKKAIDVGVSAVIAGGIHSEDLEALLGYDLGVAITGSEDVGLTLVITEGFGPLPMSGQTFQLLQDAAGKTASVSGATQIRAGVMRPEVLIPTSVKKIEETAVDTGVLEVGSTVRIIRDPHFGSLGTVTDLPPKPVALETEAKVRILNVKLVEGETIMLPRANVELVDKSL